MEKGSERQLKRRRKSRSAAKSNTSEEPYDQESLETTVMDEEATEYIETMKVWLRSEECGGISVAQNGGLLALAVYRSGTS